MKHSALHEAPFLLGLFSTSTARYLLPCAPLPSPSEPLPLPLLLAPPPATPASAAPSLLLYLCRMIWPVTSPLATSGAAGLMQQSCGARPRAAWR
jgi:hypothetical protein